MKICLITPGQPSTNPRLVKEADALVEEGYEVEAISAYWVSWAEETDRSLLAPRAWSCRYVGGSPRQDPIQYPLTRLRHGFSRRVSRYFSNGLTLKKWSLCRVSSELEKAALRTPADLYIAHNLGALPAAVLAAQKYHARVGFDAEDFHGDEYFESWYLPRCNYVTASSPEIRDAYAVKYGIPRPVSILNVFPLSHRPCEFRKTRLGGPLTLYWFSQTIGEGRGLEDVVEAMGQPKSPPLVLHLRGVWQKGYQRRLRGLAASLGLEESQMINHPPAPPEDMVRLAAEYDVGLAVEPGRDENNQIALSNKLFTCLLAGNAVVATATKSQKEVVEGLNGGGFLYEPGDVRSLSDRLRQWYEDRKSLEIARRAAWDWGSRRYNWDLEKKKFLEVIERTLFVRCAQS